MRRPVLTLLALLILPATAHAATVRLDVTPDEGRTPASSTLVYSAAPGEANQLSITLNDDVFTVDDVVPVAPGVHCARGAPGDPTRVRCTDVVDPDVEASLGDRDDIAAIDPGDAFARVDAGPGNDRVRAGEVKGRSGTDLIQGTDLAGGPGNDVEFADPANGGVGTRFFQGTVPDGDDVLIGSDADDGVSYAGRTDGVRVSLDGRVDDGAPGERDDLRNIEDVTGSKEADVLTGDGGPNL